MAKLLVIFANPKRESYTRELLQGFLASYRCCHPTDEIVELDLYQMEIPVIDEPVLQAWNKRGEKLIEEERHLLANIDRLTDLFIAADKLVFAAPMWNLHFPPMFMAYIANVVVAGKTFSYTANGTWIGLVPDKPALLLHVRGGVFSSGPAQSYDHAIPYLTSLCSLLGITHLQTIICEGVEMYPDKARQLVEQAKIRAAQLAQQF